MPARRSTLGTSLRLEIVNQQIQRLCALVQYHPQARLALPRSVPVEPAQVDRLAQKGVANGWLES
jgi:hypothetical protein